MKTHDSAIKLVCPKTIFEALSLTIHPEQAKRLYFVDAEDYSDVVRKVMEYFSEIGFIPPPDYLERGIYALKQYYAVALLDPANAHAVSVPVDPFWHFHVLHSEKYMDFCERVIGEYMHHRPLDRSKKPNLEAVRRLYSYTLDVLPQIFSTVDLEFWPQDLSDAAIICWHKGNQEIYPQVQPYRLFEPTPRGIGYAL